jgi:hypothetical protein
MTLFLLPEASIVEAANNNMRKALINSDTVVKEGTFGEKIKKREKIGEVINGSIFYNKKNQAIFFGSDGFKTAISTTILQWNDILNNNTNML